MPLPKYSFILDETYPGGTIGSALALTGRNNIKRVIRTTESPGEYKNHDSRTHETIDSAIRRISEWVGNIREDLVHSKTTGPTAVDDFTKAFQDRIDESVTDPESYFDEHEVDEINKKLDELQTRVLELEEKLNISPEETKRVEKAIEKSKSDLHVYPKGVWYKTSGTKIIKILKAILKTKEGREFISEMAKKLLA